MSWRRVHEEYVRARLHALPERSFGLACCCFILFVQAFRAPRVSTCSIVSDCCPLSWLDSATVSHPGGSAASKWRNCRLSFVLGFLLWCFLYRFQTGLKAGTETLFCSWDLSHAAAAASELADTAQNQQPFSHSLPWKTTQTQFPHSVTWKQEVGDKTASWYLFLQLCTWCPLWIHTPLGAKLPTPSPPGYNLSPVSLLVCLIHWDFCISPSGFIPVHFLHLFGGVWDLTISIPTAPPSWLYLFLHNYLTSQQTCTCTPWFPFPQMPLYLPPPHQKRQLSQTFWYSDWLIDLVQIT